MSGRTDEKSIMIRLRLEFILVLMTAMVLGLDGFSGDWIRSAQVVIDGSGSDEGMSLLKDEDGGRLKSPRTWLEYCQEKHNGQEGAYTVLRCDFGPTEYSQLIADDSIPCKVWGWDFHLNRLRESVLSLSKNDNIAQNFLTGKVLDCAHTSSEKLLRVFLKDFHDVQYCSERNFTLMITLLWTPIQSSTNMTSLIVEGHACEVSITKNPDPIDLVLALDSLESKRSLPRRYDTNPQSKLSGWCNRRKPLEYYFQIQPSIKEIILCMHNSEPENSQCIKLLEGLTSNLFVVEKSGTLRTAHEEVLHGYARTLFLEAAQSCRRSISFESPSLLDLKTGRIEEIFITSSIRIGVPVKKVFVLENETLHEIWSKESEHFPRFSSLLQQVYYLAT